MSPSRQSGATLIVSLVLLLVVTITGATALRITSLQETTTAGQRHKTLSLMAAEAGASATWAAFNGSANWWVNLPGHGSNADQAVGSNSTAYWRVANTNSLAASGGTVFVLGFARNGASGQELSRSKIKLELGNLPGDIPDVLEKGIFADNDFKVQSAATLNGNVKANVEIQVGTLTVGTNATVEDKTGGYSGRVAVGTTSPVASAFDVTTYFASEFAAANQYGGSSGCRTSSGAALPTSTTNDLGGKIYYCKADVTLASGRTYSNGAIITATGNKITTSSNLYNMKLIAGNDLLYLGGALGDAARPTDIVSGNTILMQRDASYSTFGAMWAQNDVKQEKSSRTVTVNGCMFANNTIDMLGSLVYNQAANCGSSLAAPGGPGIVTWREVTD